MRLVVNDLAINHTDGKAAEPRTQFKAGLYHLTFHSILYLPTKYRCRNTTALARVGLSAYSLVKEKPHFSKLL